MNENQQKPGPRPDHLKIDEDFEDAVAKALRKRPPEDAEGEEQWENEGGAPQDPESDD